MSKKQIKSAFHSVAGKSLILLIITTSVLLTIETLSLWGIYVLNKQAVNNYKASVDYYMTMCDDLLSEVRNAMIHISSPLNIDNSFVQMCYLKGLQFQIAKKTNQSRLTMYEQFLDNDSYLFSYVPDKNIFLTSMTKNTQYYRDLICELSNNQSPTHKAWEIVQYKGENLFARCIQEETGYVIALVSVKSLFEGLFNENEDNACQIKIYENDTGECLYTESTSNKFKEKRADCFSYSMNNSNLTIKVYLDRGNSGIAASMEIILCTFLISLFVIFLYIYHHIKFLLQPFTMLRHGMEEFSSGNFDIRLPLTGLSVEMLQLFTTFNDMIMQIQKLKIDIYESEIEKEKVYSDYIRIQIQPHFYANILNLIYGMSKLQDVKSIENLSLHAGAYFRYLLGNKGTFVKIKDEIEGLKHYLEIQKMRYEDLLAYTINIPKDLQNEIIIPMLIQTFVENSIKHNITFVPVLEVKVSIEHVGSKLFIMIKDNGMGISEEIIKQIDENKLGTENGTHIGIRNVKARLRLMYGEQANLTIHSHKGTTVEIMVPKLINKNMDEDSKNEPIAG